MKQALTSSSPPSELVKSYSNAIRDGLSPEKISNFGFLGEGGDIGPALGPAPGPGPGPAPGPGPDSSGDSGGMGDPMGPGGP